MTATRLSAEDWQRILEADAWWWHVAIIDPNGRITDFESEVGRCLADWLTYVEDDRGPGHSVVPISGMLESGEPVTGYNPENAVPLTGWRDLRNWLDRERRRAAAKRMRGW
jgi:hypothetical protein